MRRVVAFVSGGILMGIIVSVMTLVRLPVWRGSSHPSAATYTVSAEGDFAFEHRSPGGAEGWKPRGVVRRLKSMNTAKRPRESRTDTTTWKPFQPVEGPLVRPFDASVLLDPPAGRHGFLTAEEDGHFYFEDGTPVRFFGLNIQGAQALPTHEKAERLAQRLAQLGCNMVRLHHLDAPWAQPNIFDSAFDDTQHLSAERLDRLDYFIAQLKARGIYVYLDLLVNRVFKAGDHVPGYRRLERGAAIVAQYSSRLIQLQKQYARDLLTHYNPYTETRFVNESAIALVGLINESSIFALPKSLETIPPFYLDELGTLWVEYLAGQGLTESVGDAEWYLDSDDPLVQEFYASLQLRYFDELSGYLRGLGLQIPIAGSNLTRPGQLGMDRDLLTNASLDFIDRHAYWDHPKGGFGDFVQFQNRLVTEGGKDPNPLTRLSRDRVKGKPFVVSEWNIAWPNEYRAAGPMLMAAYASFQDWDGLLHFNYQGELMPERIESNFDVSTKPELFLQFPAAARLFHRRDVAPAVVRETYPIFSDEEIPQPLVLLHGIERSLQGGSPIVEREVRSPWVTDTDELDWDAKQGLVLIETPRTQAAIGRVGGVPIELKAAIFSVTTPFACLILTSLDDQPLENSRQILLTTVARSENTGTVYNATRTLLRDSGISPILMEPVVGSMLLPLGERGGPRVFALDAGGRRLREVASSTSEGIVEVPLGEAHTYEILFEEPS